MAGSSNRPFMDLASEILGISGLANVMILNTDSGEMMNAEELFQKGAGKGNRHARRRAAKAAAKAKGSGGNNTEKGKGKGKAEQVSFLGNLMESRYYHGMLEHHIDRILEAIKAIATVAPNDPSWTPHEVSYIYSCARLTDFMAKMGLFEWSSFNFLEQQHQMRNAINPRQQLQALSLPCELCETTVEKVLEEIPDESVQLNIKLQKLEKIVDSVGSLAVVLDMPHECYMENRDLIDNFNYYTNNQSEPHELAVLTATLIMNHAVDLHTGTGKGKGKSKADFYDNEGS